jgi:hypothetical protein
MWLVISSLPAMAQPAPEPEPAPPPAEQPPPPEAPKPAIDPRIDAGWELYHQVFDAVARGHRAHARDLAVQLLRDYPTHPATNLVRKSELGVGPGTIDDHGDRTEKPSRSARAELGAFQTMHGIAVGIEFCVVIKCDSGGAAFGAALTGGIAGLFISLNAVDNLTPGQRALINSGTVWGATNAALILIATEPSDAETYGLGLLAGQGIGVATGVVMFRGKPTAGQVALANSGGQWAGVLTGLTIAALDDHPDGKQVAIALLVAVDAGLVGGSYIASRKPQVSRAQTLVIDAGGIVGAVGGGSLGVVLSGNFDDRSTPGLAAIGAAVGLGTAAYFTRNWSNEGSGTSVQSYILPVERGRGATAGIGFAW